MVIPFAATPIQSMLDHLNDTMGGWFKAATTIIGLIVLIVGIVALLMGIWSIHKGQPSTKNFIVALLALLIGGYFTSSGFAGFKSLGQTTGKDSIDEVLGK